MYAIVRNVVSPAAISRLAVVPFSFSLNIFSMRIPFSKADLTGKYNTGELGKSPAAQTLHRC
jgi:hypothetical protein